MIHDDVPQNVIALCKKCTTVAYSLQRENQFVMVRTEIFKNMFVYCFKPLPLLLEVVTASFIL